MTFSHILGFLINSLFLIVRHAFSLPVPRYHLPAPVTASVLSTCPEATAQTAAAWRCSRTYRCRPRRSTARRGVRSLTPASVVPVQMLRTALWWARLIRKSPLRKWNSPDRSRSTFTRYRRPGRRDRLELGRSHSPKEDKVDGIPDSAPAPAHRWSDSSCGPEPDIYDVMDLPRPGDLSTSGSAPHLSQTSSPADSEEGTPAAARPMDDAGPSRPTH